jgi:uncharacterized protein (DUF305 family)
MQSLMKPIVAMIMVLLLAACGNTPTPDNSMEGMDHGSTPIEEGTGEGEHDMGAMDAEVDQLATLSGDEFEIAFLDGMIAHHQGAVVMSQLALERSSNGDLQRAAQGIINAQSVEINQMTGWLSQWHGQTPTASDVMAMTAETDAMRTLPDAEFDKAFLEAMIAHHESAIEMARLIPERTERAELQQLGEAIITTQEAEIAQFNGWLAEGQ